MKKVLSIALLLSCFGLKAHYAITNDSPKRNLYYKAFEFRGLPGAKTPIIKQEGMIPHKKGVMIWEDVDAIEIVDHDNGDYLISLSPKLRILSIKDNR